MMLRKSACFLICFFLSVLGAFAVSGDLGAPFDIVFTKTGVTDYEFYDPATGIVSNSFTFIENANGDAEESFGIKCRIYNSSTFKDLTVLFTDNYSNSHMLRHMDADDFYNYTITADIKEGGEYLTSSGDLTPDAKAALDQASRTITFTKNAGVTVPNPIDVDIVFDLDLYKAGAFVTGQYSGQIIMTLEFD